MHKQKCKKDILVLTGLIIFNLVLIQNIIFAEEWTQVYSPEVEIVKEPMAAEDKLDQMISIDYKNADLASVIRSLSWTYKLNIVTSADIKGKVNVSLKDVTVKDALGAILAINGLAYSEREGIIYVSPGDPEAVELQSEVIFLKYTSASGAQNFLKRVVSPRGDMKINELANSLIVTDFPANIDKVKTLLGKIDIPPQQVLIEAELVDISSTDLKAIGVTYDADYSPGHGIFDRQTKYSEQLKSTVTMNEQSDSLSGGQFVLNTLTAKWITVTATIDALVRDGKASLLASPSVVVLNNEEARIIIGERYPYKERTQTTTGTTETTKFVDIGTTLRVTPQINADGYITMRVHPEVSSLYSSLDAGPRITTREADTTVRIKEGETLIIAGLIKKTDDRANERIPILGDIPIIGLLFSRTAKDVGQKELAVFITPRIISSKEEIEKLGRKKDEAGEMHVSLTNQTGELSLVEGLFQAAKSLDVGIGIESVRKNERFRKNQAIGMYQHIYLEFPESPQAPEAMYKAALIYANYIKDYKKARNLFTRVISDYAKSPFAEKAKNEFYKIEGK